MKPARCNGSTADPADILLVDDTPANLQVLAGMLKERGHKVRPVPSGKLALLAAQREPPDLILLDINMPEMNGYQVCEQLKADEWLRGIPVIFISALAEPLDKVRAFAFGGVDYITKPFQMEELHARVETHLKLHRLQVQLEDSNARLERANDRMSRDLKAAARIQNTFLPRASCIIQGIELAWAYNPCDELGGDGLNIIPLGEGKVGLYILDVSGHGVSAALLSVTLSRMLSPPTEPASILYKNQNGSARAEITPPSEVADELNRLFRFDNLTGQYATLMYGVVDLASGIFRYVAAGHPGPLHLPAGGEPLILETSGSPIGIAEEDYQANSLQVGPGDRLYLYSDGLSDARNAAGESFGDRRLTKAIADRKSMPLAEGVTSLLAEIAEWQGAERPHDDISLLAIEIHVSPTVA
jgi:sigma-B regulation protein RsbU (phosphoserine phosphatase)